MRRILLVIATFVLLLTAVSGCGIMEGAKDEIQATSQDKTDVDIPDESTPTATLEAELPITQPRSVVENPDKSKTPEKTSSDYLAEGDYSSAETAANEEYEKETEAKAIMYEGKYLGSSIREQFHTNECPVGLGIPDDALIIFDTRDEAVSANYKPCGFCNP